MFDAAMSKVVGDAAPATPAVVRPVTVEELERLVSPPPAATVHDVSAAIDEAAALQERINALEGLQLVAVEKARRAAMRCQADLLDEAHPELARAGAARRRELAERAFASDLAVALHLGEHRASHLVDTARILAVDGRTTF